MWVRSLGREDTLEKGTTTHSSILAWEILWTEEPGGLQSIASQGVRHDIANTNTTDLTVTNLTDLTGNKQSVGAVLERREEVPLEGFKGLSTIICPPAVAQQPSKQPSFVPGHLAESHWDSDCLCPWDIDATCFYGRKANQREKEHIYDWFVLLYDRNQHIVNQFSSN